MLTAGIIDVHTHYVPPSVAELARGGPALPRMVIESDDCGQLCRGETLDRPVDARTWDGARRIADMDAGNVIKQVVSPVPMMFAYDCPLSEALPLLQTTNDGIATLVANRPDRFAGLAGIPLQDVDAACAEARRAIVDLGLAGIEIGSCGAYEIDDVAYEPLWSLCEELGAVVFVHPDDRAIGFGRLKHPGLVPAIGYPSETGIIAAKLIMSGLFVRHPRLRLLLAHGGGTLAWMLPRLDRVWSRHARTRSTLDDAPSTHAKRFYFDTLTFDAMNLSLLAERIGTGRLVIGTDYPFTLAEDPPGETLANVSRFSAAERTAMLRDNAVTLLERG